MTQTAATGTFGADALETGRRIDEGRLDPRDLLEAALDRAAAHPHAGEIFTLLTPDRARAEAADASARARRNARLSPLDGVPVTWKDLFDTAGVPTEAGTRLLAGRIPARDAALLRRAGAAGMVCLGKTHMTELAFSGLGLNPMTASPPCVNDPDAVSGGSSSGAAASVAFGLAPLAIGSDTGGSIRLPAAWNDLVGFKPTQGLLPMEGVVPLIPSFDTPGPLARNVVDAAAMFAVLSGRGEAAAGPAGSRCGVAGLRLAVLQDVALDGLEGPTGPAFEAALVRLSARGARIMRLRAPEVGTAMALSGALFAPEAWGFWGTEIAARPDLVYPPIRERFEAGAGVSAAEHVAAWRHLRGLRRAWWARVSGLDGVLLPAAPIMPPARAAVAADAAHFTERNLMALRNTRIGNLLGACALTFPTGVASTGLMLMAPPLAEARLLDVGAAREAALG
ncbi:MAG: amidase [Rhodobacteraceae bacterium]|nr:amidase [Paracoccaceae bacterium]